MNTFFKSEQRSIFKKDHFVISNNEKVSTPSLLPGSLLNTLLWMAIKLRIFYFACIVLKYPDKIFKTFIALIKLRTNVWGGDMKKICKINDKYYFNIYTPGWPSKEYDLLIKNELIRHSSTPSFEERLSFVFLAITRKCPMKCEHCFEWDNLNQKESFTKEDLFKTIDIYQNEGVLQFHFSGGEPLVRIKELLEVMHYASRKSACWVITSGFNLTPQNAILLKNAGCKGVVVSIDHYNADLHNLFRGNPHSFLMATNGVKAALDAGLVTAISVCTTKGFIDGNHLLPYIEFAKNLNVHFVQLLEPKNVGHYKYENVLLSQAQSNRLEKVFTDFNNLPEYKTYPTIMYHGYHQRRVGCFAGTRSIYVDSVGDVHACPFCHTAAYNILHIIKEGRSTIPNKENKCPRYNKIA